MKRLWAVLLAAVAVGLVAWGVWAIGHDAATTDALRRAERRIDALEERQDEITSALADSLTASATQDAQIDALEAQIRQLGEEPIASNDPPAPSSASLAPMPPSASPPAPLERPPGPSARSPVCTPDLPVVPRVCIGRP